MRHADIGHVCDRGSSWQRLTVTVSAVAIGHLHPRDPRTPRPCARCPPRCRRRSTRRRAPTYSISDLAQRVRADHARDPLLRGRAACSRRDGAGSARVYGERERVRHQADPARQAAGPCAVRDPRAPRPLRGRAQRAARSSSKFLQMLAERRARLLQQQEDIDAVLAEIDGIERDCRRRLQGRRRRREADRRARLTCRTLTFT